ncbi:MAG: DUF4336 domain-containing protein [Hyphomicrobiales bacterium]
MLDKLAPNLWIAEGQCVNFHGFAYPTRSVVVRLESGDMWVWSPIKISDELAHAVEYLGPVRHLISPNKIHHLFLTEWHQRFPDALLWGPASTIKKRKDLNFQQQLNGVAPHQWGNDFEQFHVEGSLAMDEILFRHKPSKTLILADFSENFGDAFLNKNWKSWQLWLARKWGIVEGKGYAPLDWRLSFVRRTKLRYLREQLHSDEIEKVVMAHGEIQHSNGNAYMKQSLRWI